MNEFYSKIANKLTSLNKSAYRYITRNLLPKSDDFGSVLHNNDKIVILFQREGFGMTQTIFAMNIEENCFPYSTYQYRNYKANNLAELVKNVGIERMADVLDVDRIKVIKDEKVLDTVIFY